MTRIATVMTVDALTIAPGDPLGLATRLMSTLNVRVLPVCDGRILLGVVTDRDIVNAAAAKLPADIAVSSVLSPPEDWICNENDLIADVQERMTRLQVQQMLVVNRVRELTGIVSLESVSGAVTSRTLRPDA